MYFAVDSLELEDIQNWKITLIIMHFKHFFITDCVTHFYFYIFKPFYSLSILFLIEIFSKLYNISFQNI